MEASFNTQRLQRATPNRGGPTERAPREWVPELRNSNCSDVRQNYRKNTFSKRVLEESFCESVAGEHTQLSPKDFPLSFTRAHFLPGITYFLADFVCRFPTRSRMFALGWLTVAWECLERTLGVLGALIWFCDLIISWHAVMIWSWNIVIWSCSIVIRPCNIVIWSCNIVIWPWNIAIWSCSIAIWSCKMVILWYDHVIWWYDHKILWYDDNTLVWSYKIVILFF